MDREVPMRPDPVLPSDALRDSEEFLRATLAVLPIGIAQADPRTGRLLLVNDALCRMLGYTAEELVGRQIHDLTHPADRERDDAGFRQAVSGEAAGHVIEKRYVRKDGSVAWGSVRMEVLRDASGNATRSVATIEDITERRAAEMELRESRERYRALVESSFASEQRYRAMFEFAAMGVAQALPATGMWTAVNPRFCAITGYSESELLSMRVAELTHPEDRERDWQLFQRVVRGELPEYRLEKRYVRKDGSVAWVNVNMVVLRDEKGKAERTLAMIEDITERKRASRRLALQASMGRILVEVESLAVAMPEILRAIGESEGFAFGAWWELDPDTEGLRCAHAWSADPDRAAALETATRGAGIHCDKCVPRRVWVSREPVLVPSVSVAGCPRIAIAASMGLDSAVGFPILRRGEPVGVVEFFATGITALDPALSDTIESLGSQVALYLERKRAQEETARYIAGNPVVLYAQRLVGKAPRVTWFSENIAAFSGYSRNEIAVAPERWWLENIHPDDRARVLDAQSDFTRHEAQTVEFRLHRKDGAWLWVRDEKRVLRDAEGRATEFVGSWVDVTERVHLEAQLRQSQKMEAVGQLAGGVAHDFNNLLTVITGNCDLLLGGTSHDDPKRGPLADIHAAAERAANLTRQLLAFSRKQILEPKLVDVNDVLRDMERLLRRLIGEDIDLATDLMANPSWVKVDRGQLEQVVMNLAVNARDAMPRGGRLTLRTHNSAPVGVVDLEETAERGLRPRVAISIVDSGSGIPPEVRARLFEPFFTTKEAGKGTGLGLATVYGIVKQSGGDITVESEPGKGSTFTVVLPSKPAPRRRGSGASTRTVPRGTETILAVEDEDAVRRIVKIALESTGYRVIEARSGPEALAAGRRHPGRIDLLVTDVVMPEMSGRNLAERFVKEHPGIRVLYMSGYTDDAVVRHGVAGAGVAFLQKPFSPLALARKVREVLDAKA